MDDEERQRTTKHTKHTKKRRIEIERGEARIHSRNSCQSWFPAFVCSSVIRIRVIRVIRGFFLPPSFVSFVHFVVLLPLCDPFGRR